jgi:hypothetical protein
MNQVRRNSWVGAACIALLVGALAGCGGGGGSSASTGTTTAGDHRGGTLVLDWNGIGSSIDPAVDYDQNWGLLNLVYDGLVTWKKVGGPAGNTLVPDLATSVPTPTDGGKTYTFTLRKNIRFSNGAAVKASDFLRAIEREFTVPGPVGSFYQGIVGGNACAKTPKTCDLSKGIVTDDAAGTVTFHLTQPDPDFLQKLALPFGYAVPANTPDKEVGPSSPLPATGPYMIDHYTPNQEILLVRNPHFRQWSKDAQPAGYPDQIEIRLSLTTEAEVTQIEQNQADWMYDQPPNDRLNEIATKYPNQVHLNPVPQVYHMAMNTRAAPFDNLKVRQAVNYATDRSAIVKAWGGPQLATPTCQILPPDFPGYKPYCPYTVNAGDGKWHGPEDRRDLHPRRCEQVGLPLLRLALQAARLRLEHQGAERRRGVPLRAGLEQQGPDQLLVLVSGLSVGSRFLRRRRRLPRLPPEQHGQREPVRVLRPARAGHDGAGHPNERHQPGRRKPAVGGRRQGDDRSGAVDLAVSAPPHRLHVVARRQLHLRPQRAGGRHAARSGVGEVAP